MVAKEKNKILNIFVYIFGVIYIAVLFLNLKWVTIPNLKNIQSLIYCIFLLSCFIGCFLFFVLKKRFQKKAEIFIFILLLTFSFFFRIFFMDFETNDFIHFLSLWCKEYKIGSIADAMRSKVSNYMPAYNYFLIIFARTRLNDLYEIKLLSFIFELLTAFLILKIASKISNKLYSPVYFGVILLCGVFLINSSVWAQCDSIYTYFGLLAFYYALQKKSIRSFICFGISLALKMQALFLFPIALLLLLSKDQNSQKYLKWRYVFIVPVVFFLINLLPFFFGKSLWDIYSVYFIQTSTYAELSKNCANLATFFSLLKQGGIGYNIVLIMLVLITLAYLVCICYFSLRAAKIKGTLSIYDFVLIAFCFCFGIVFLMPKMLDRFLYFAVIFSIIWAIINKNNRSFILCCCLNIGVMFSFMQYIKTTPINLAPINALFSVGAFLLLMYEFYYIIIKAEKKLLTE